MLRRFAYERSSFYRDFHTGKKDAPLVELPVLTKTTLMERWDEVATDSSVSRDRVLRFGESLHDPAVLDGRYLVATGAAAPEVVVDRVAALEQTIVGKTPLVRGLREDDP